ncbi:metal ABC transporter substrate-binding protein (plasmid) [Azospirillum argentinense]|uniref:Metal ABC transporter substrate-binding protein n=2 Tax=Azospirillum argentinense TaxID=2970906 RepID=A0A2K1G4Z2_9PROT|nr:MetQ/NlpA family ABC transporter substrate-binding protein [Azospirillum argentinense]PNQ99857.1 metal ABC transporter substrate-binding protein [Azospirillum argentinense]
MKRLILAATGLLLALAAPAQAQTQAQTIKVGATSGPHAQILEVVKANAAKDGLDIQIVEFTEYIQPNAALAAGDLEANSYQHLPFLKAQIDARGYDIVPVGKTTLFPIAVYSKRHKTVADLPADASISIPNDPSNGARSLLLLESAGLIKLKPGAGIKATPLDIVENPKKLKIVELESPQLVHSLDDVDASAVNTNYALEAKLNPVKDSLILESPQSQYTCEIVVRKKDADQPWVQKLVAAYQSPVVKEFIQTKFNGAAVPGW